MIHHEGHEGRRSGPKTGEPENARIAHYGLLAGKRAYWPGPKVLSANRRGPACL
jgi:hypothetical protein